MPGRKDGDTDKKRVVLREMIYPAENAENAEKGKILALRVRNGCGRFAEYY